MSKFSLLSFLLFIFIVLLHHSVITSDNPVSDKTAPSIAPVTTSETTLLSLQSCLGKLINQLVTPTQSFSSNPYYQYDWLMTGIYNNKSILAYNNNYKAIETLKLHQDCLLLSF